MSHANATLTPVTRLRPARLIVDDGWTCQAEDVMVAPKTARKWADRYRLEGVAGMADRGPGCTSSLRPPRARAALSTAGLSSTPGARSRSEGSIPASTSACILITVLSDGSNASVTALLPFVRAHAPSRWRPPVAAPLSGRGTTVVRTAQLLSPGFNDVKILRTINPVTDP